MLLKVFLVEDETVIREGLRDRIPWDQFGYRFVGEAADGEMALPLIRKTRPDVLITDIKMPFMDGYSVRKNTGNHGNHCMDLRKNRRLMMILSCPVFTVRNTRTLHLINL